MPRRGADLLESYCRRWSLLPDGDVSLTPSGLLLPVRRDGAAAMLKMSHVEEERRGGALMAWWDGDGAAPVLAHDATALLLRRAEGPSLSRMCRDGRDEDATRVLCAVAARLHAGRSDPAPRGLIPLEEWFRELAPAASGLPGILARCADTARDLLASQEDRTILHGDLHHDNVLDFGARGWLAIDPKGLVGERAFEFAILFANPDLADTTRPFATDRTVFRRRLDIVSDAARLDRRCLLEWILAWSGLSAVWFQGDADPRAEIELAIACFAAAELDAL